MRILSSAFLLDMVHGHHIVFCGVIVKGSDILYKIKTQENRKNLKNTEAPAKV